MGRSGSVSRVFSADLAYCVALVAGVLIVYGQVASFGFVGYDDNVYVYRNPLVQAGLTGNGALWAFTSTATSNWHPLTWLSLMLDAQLGGPAPRTFHVGNLLFHLANTLLLYALLLRMTRHRARSAFVAALFAVHPLHVESVAWIAERKDLLSTFFWLLTMHAYLRYVKSPGARRYLPVLLLLGLGLMAKPMLVTAPLLLLVLDFWPLRRRGIRKLVLEKIPLLCLSILSSAVAVYTQRAAGALGDMQVFPLSARIGNAIVAYVAYLGKAFWPSKLAVFYPHRGEALGSLPVVLSAALLATITVLAILGAGRRPYLLAGWLWYGITLVPVIGLVQVGLQSMADRYTYVPLVGIFLIVAWGVPDLLELRSERAPSWALASACALLLLVLAVAAHRQVGTWRDGPTLFRHAVDATTENAVAQHLLGSALHDAGDNQGALEHWSEAVRIVPDYVNARSDLAGALVQLGRVEEGVAQYRRVLAIDPRHVKAHTSLGIVLLAQGHAEEAVEHLSASLRERPDDAETESYLGAALMQLRRYQEAVDHLQRSLRIDPGRRDSRLRLGASLANVGRTQEAITELETLLRLDPGNRDAGRALALLRGEAPEP